MASVTGTVALNKDLAVSPPDWGMHYALPAGMGGDDPIISFKYSNASLVLHDVHGTSSILAKGEGGTW